MNLFYNWIKRHDEFVSLIYRLFGRNHKDIAKGNIVFLRGCFMKSSSIKILGKNNRVVMEDGNIRLRGCSIFISGNNNVIEISSDCRLSMLEIHIEDDGNRVHIGRRVEMYGPVHLAAIEGTNITIGDDCLFSQNVSVRTGDSHSILDLIRGVRINPSKDVRIAHRVWVGNGATILKGCEIQNDSVIAAGAILTRQVYEENAVYGGNPARMLKKGVTWTSKRI